MFSNLLGSNSMKVTLRELGKQISFLDEHDDYIPKKGIVAAVYTGTEKCMVLVTDKKDVVSDNEILSLPMNMVSFDCIDSVTN